MERVVKFRGKTLSGKWVYGDLVHFTNTQGVDTSVIITEHQATAESDDFDYALCYARNEFKIVLPESVGQFTGLYDVNGEEIYEGDVVRNKEVGGYGFEYLGVVRYYKEDARFGIDTTATCKFSKRVLFSVGESCINDGYCTIKYTNKYEVIGNIHDNPNFLTDGRD